MSTKITRESFISPDIDKVAISKETMFAVGEDGESIVEVPIPESIKTSGIIPEGYTVGVWTYLFCFQCLNTTIALLDFHLDPATVISALAKANITTMESVRASIFLSFSLQIYNVKFDVFRDLTEEQFASIKGTINDAENVTIAPIDVVENVRRIIFIFIFTEFFTLSETWSDGECTRGECGAGRRGGRRGRGDSREYVTTPMMNINERLRIGALRWNVIDIYRFLDPIQRIKRIGEIL